MVFGNKSDVNGLRIGLPFFEPEKMAFADTKTFQVWVTVFAFVVWKGGDPKWLESLGIESDGALEIADCENNVVDHVFLSVFVGGLDDGVGSPGIVNLAGQTAEVRSLDQVTPQTLVVPPLVPDSAPTEFFP